MATGTIITNHLANGQRSYKVVYRPVPGGPQKTKTFKRKADAERFKAQQLGAAVAGTWIDPKAGQTLFRVYAERWRLAQQHAPGTVAKVESSLRNHVYPAIGDRRLDSIRRTELQELIQRMELSPAATTVVARYISSIFKAAVADKMIAESPWQRITLPAVSKSRTEIVPTEWIARLERSFVPHLQAIIPFTAGTGLRQGEVFGLTLDRVDFKERTIVVDRQLTSANGTRPEFAPVKNHRKIPRRVVPLAPVVVGLLRAHIDTYGLGEDDLIFTTGEKHRLWRTRWSEDLWHPAKQRAGLADVTFTMHDLRHYYASALIRHGASVKTVQTRLGHASATETLETYAHLWPDDDVVSRQAVEDVLTTRAAALAAYDKAQAEAAKGAAQQ